MRRNLAARIGVWSAHHRKTAIIGWLLFVVLATVVGGASGMVEMSESEQGTGDSARAQKILDDAGLDQPAGELVTGQQQDGRTAGRTRRASWPRPIEKTGEAQKVEPPLASEERQGSADPLRDQGRLEDGRGPGAAGARRRTGRPAGPNRASRSTSSGRPAAEKWLGDLLSDDFQQAEFTAVPLALGILLVAFGALVAALLPVGSRAHRVHGGLRPALARQPPAASRFQTTYSVMFLMGLAVGVDYCLFYLRRERDERAAGRDAETALRIAAATSGRAVLVSGVTVMRGDGRACSCPG